MEAHGAEDGKMEVAEDGKMEVSPSDGPDETSLSVGASVGTSDGVAESIVVGSGVGEITILSSSCAYLCQNSSSFTLSELAVPNLNAARNATVVENFIVDSACYCIGFVPDDPLILINQLFS